MDEVGMATYKRADGEPIAGEYAFVTDREYVEDEAYYAEGPVEFVEQVWELVGERRFTLPKCAQCDEVATYWGLCEKHAREDDPDAFDTPAVHSEGSGDG